MINRYFIAVIIILIGIGLLLEQMTFWNFGYVFSTWWPLIIVILGVMNLSQSKGSVFPGIIIILVGLLLLGDQLHLITGGFWGAFWPLIFIAFGSWLIFGRRHFFHKKFTINQNFPKFNTVFSGSKNNIESENFEGAEIMTMFGGTEINMRRASISPDGAVIDISVSFGGVTLFIPETWRIEVSGAPMFGAFENKTRNRNLDENAPCLRIKYFVMFGGIELKN